MNLGYTRIGCGAVHRVGDGNMSDNVVTTNTSGDISSQFLFPKTIIKKETKMAEVDTAVLAGQHADIRREVGVGFGDIRYNVASEHCKTNDIVRQEGQENVMAVKDGTHNVLNTVLPAVGNTKDMLGQQINSESDRVADRIMETRGLIGERFYTVGRDLADIRQGQATLAKDVELNTLKTQLDAAKNTSYIVEKITSDGDKTRTLINDLKYHDLNRSLVERHSELVNCEQDRRWGRDRYFDIRFDQVQNQYAGQWAQLQNQVQAFQSQLQETRQGLVNFGTMAGAAGQQTSTSNNVR
jgi:hypothetical protein